MWAKMISRNIMRQFSTQAVKKVSLPELKFGYSALQPVISSKLLETHHKKHHQAYVNNLNAALDQFEGISILTQKLRPTLTTTKLLLFARQSSLTSADTLITRYTGKTQHPLGMEEDNTQQRTPFSLIKSSSSSDPMIILSNNSLKRQCPFKDQGGDGLAMNQVQNH